MRKVFKLEFTAVFVSVWPMCSLTMCQQVNFFGGPMFQVGQAPTGGPGQDEWALGSAADAADL